MKSNQMMTNKKKIRRAGRGVLGQKLTAAQVRRLKDWVAGQGATETACMVERMRGGITVQEACIFLALTRLELGRKNKTRVQ